MRKICKAFVLLVVSLILSITLFSCGKDKGNKITQIEAGNFSYTMKYRGSVPTNPFDIKICYSNGDKISLENLSEDIQKDISVTAKYHNPITHQDEDFDLSNEMVVGNYTLTYSYKKYSCNVSLNVEKANYTGSVFVNLQNNSMTYGGALAKPSISTTSADVESVYYYYQEYSSENAYSDTYSTYDYTEGATCTIMPGQYQIYADIVFKNYENYRTPLRQFNVSRTAGQIVYGLFVHDYFDDTNPYKKVSSTNPVECEYNLTYSKVSDYLSSVELNGLCICEVDDSGNVKRDEFNYVNEYSINLNDEYSTMELTYDSDVNQIKTYTGIIKFTPDRTLYNPVNISFALKVNKIKAEVVNMGDKIGIIYGDSNYQGSIIYDGEEHHIALDNVLLENSKYYGYKLYGNDTKIKLYEIVNYSARNAGTYTVRCNLLDSVKNFVEFKCYNYDTQESEIISGNTVNIGVWQITPRSYNVEADIKLNDNALDDYGVDGNYYLLYGNSYQFSASNIKVYNGDTVDSTISYSLKNVKAYIYTIEGYEEVTTGITVNDKTVTIANNIDIDYIRVVVTFGDGNINHSDYEKEIFFTLRHGVVLDNVIGEINNIDDSPRFVKWYETTNDNGFVYVSIDEQNYSSWDSIYESLYVDDNGNKILNTSNKIDFTKTYYLNDNENYVSVKFYTMNYESDNKINNNSNVVGFDLKDKQCVDATLYLSGSVFESWSTIYNQVYLDVEGTRNTSSTISFENTSYYKKVGDNYIYLYAYYKNGNSYVYTDSLVDGVTDYYLSTINAYTNFKRLEKKVDNEWVTVSENWDEGSSDVGLYRSVFSYTNINCILVDSTGKYINEIYYEWEIVDNLKHVKALSYDLNFETIGGDPLYGTNGVITIGNIDTPLVVTGTVTLDQDINYMVIVRYEYSGGWSEGTGLQLYDAGTFNIKLFVCSDEDILLIDYPNHQVEYLEYTFTLEIV